MVCKILGEFCKETWRVLSPEYLPSSFLTQDKIEEHVKGFKMIGFPQCFGAIDGCHIEIKPAAGEAVDYHNYKGWNSVVLFALVDYRCRFTYINVGSPGRCHDSQIYDSSALKRLLASSPLLRTNSVQMGSVMVPVLVLGDSAFRLTENVMKPYPFSTAASEVQKNFNYSLSRARRVVENAFGHLKAPFRRIGKGLDNRPWKVNDIIKCCCVLHNYFNCSNNAISDHWQAEAEIQQRPQPDQPLNYDCNLGGEQLRSAIAYHLSKNFACLFRFC